LQQSRQIHRTAGASEPCDALPERVKSTEGESTTMHRTRRSMAFLGGMLAATSVAAGIATHRGAPRAANSISALGDLAAPQTPGASGYYLSKMIKLGGDGGWDYITFDSETRRLYISRATKVVVLDVDSEKVFGEIPNTQGVHGIALAVELGRGFISDGRSNDITIFDLKTLKTLGTVPAGSNPDAIVFDPGTKRVFAMNGRSKNATVIDAASGKPLGTIELPGKPEFAVAGGRGNIFVNIQDKNQIARIDADKLQVTATWPLAPCESPSGLAMDRVKRLLFSGCDNKMMAIMDADSGKLIATPPIGEGVDANAFDPGTGYAFASNGQSGTLTVVHEDSPGKFTVIENVPTKRGARTMALDRETHQVFLVTADFGPAPEATPDNPHPRPAPTPGSFVVLIYAKK
jgi:DNA-binding beta-propeller fold protein YncE